MQCSATSHLGNVTEVYAAEFGEEHDTALVAAGDFTGDGGARAVMELRQRDPGLTAIFCANDLMAMGAIMALSQAGVKVPEEVSVVGYDGSFFTAYTSPPLTTVRHANDRIGYRAAEMLMELLNGGAGRRETIAPILTERRSVSKPPLHESKEPGL